MQGNKKRKILYTSHTANFHKFNRPYMRMMRRKGWEVHYASAGEEKIYDADKVFCVSFARSPYRIDKHIKAYRQMKKIINSSDYKIIHTHTPVGAVVTRLAARSARKKGTRVVYTAHGFHFYTGASKLNWLIWYPVERIMARFTDDIITINTEDYDRAKAKLKSRIHYTAGVGVNPKHFKRVMTKSQKTAFKKSLGLSSDAFVISYVAELNSNKNHQKIINDFRDYLKLSDTHLLFIGEGKLGYRLKSIVRKLDLQSHIHFLGYRDDVPKLLNITDLYISASRREGLGLNVIEARYSGCPILCTDNRGHRDAVRGVSIFSSDKILKDTYSIYTASPLIDEHVDMIDLLTQAAEMHRV